ncbi:type II secretion system inner membrane protein GspF [Pseudomonas putida]|jgi:general secretion pathway protein F|uniref:General secretion pathway protein F n=1 Tax=Pseudomonas putida TaxID=303 RepID=A0A2S3X0A6_PSEPU|nr:MULTISPECIES: type II secretion system inner membrane protein GspF [Pseudomonas]EKT4531552.1 type II secretion system inner membrane protein GspF [Pseudomonas putida]MCG3642943.1 type II secretion system inner membrane protein GspF [Pseudomonas putida]MDD2014977.1 type II secretion system inner membrane protein GspF [Pseudomonas putida]MDD2073304.1 type II secretion system inner membrane protein GspF [Pseudomonas putida]MDF3172308.1 type II secretion system inner membrane protein GspF [Pseu
MAVFSFIARNNSGVRQRGCVEASSAQQARQQLRDQGLFVLKVKAARQSSFSIVPVRRRLTLARRCLLTRQLSTLLQAGVPLTEALQAVAAQNGQRQVRQVLLGVAERVVEGNTFADALAHYPLAFPVVYRATIAAAERSGYLAAVLERLAEHGEHQQALRQRVQLAMAYPAILMVVSLLVVGFLLGYVVPDVVQAFSRDHAQLPLATRVLIALSDAAGRYGVIAVLALAALIASIALALHHPARKRQWHALALQLPGYAEFVRTREAARFVSTLAILGRSGVVLVEAMSIGAGVVGNLVLRERLLTAVREVAEGATLASSLARSKTLPALMLHMIASGERAGELDSMLERAADLQEKHLAGRISLLVSLCEPLMLLVMGGIVLFIVLAILLPILNLNQLVN